jgi:8-oxo-dGTP diphosphatase
MSNPAIQVAAGVVVNPQGQILVAKRPQEKHQGGLWEFPGGKIEAGESAHEALARELHEEVGIRITVSEPLITIKHSYPDKTVCLRVLRVTQFNGKAWGREGQDVAWVPPADLLNLDFPAANKPIVAAARLPQRLMITGAFDTETEFLHRLQQGLKHQVGMVQFRAPWLNQEDYVHLARKAHAVCRSHGIPLVANCPLEAFQKVRCEGLHLPSAALRQASVRPVTKSVWLSAACHDFAEIQQAQSLGVDFVSLSPVQSTTTHPDQPAIGWERFQDMVEQAALPVYALGGIQEEDLARATAAGAQGIAAVGAFWNR